ncbi:unnamed protein product, partial [Sphacelaria rigidula]
PLPGSVAPHLFHGEARVTDSKSNNEPTGDGEDCRGYNPENVIARTSRNACTQNSKITRLFDTSTPHRARRFIDQNVGTTGDEVRTVGSPECLQIVERNNNPPQKSATTHQSAGFNQPLRATKYNSEKYKMNSTSTEVDISRIA